MSDAALALIVAGFGIVVFLVLAGFGAARVMSRGKVLRERIDGYRDLPIIRTFEVTEARAIATQRAAAGIPLLRARAVAAVSEIGNAGKRIRLIVQTVRLVVRNMLGAA